MLEASIAQGYLLAIGSLNLGFNGGLGVGVAKIKH